MLRLVKNCVEFASLESLVFSKKRSNKSSNFNPNYVYYTYYYFLFMKGTSMVMEEKKNKPGSPVRSRPSQGNSTTRHN